MSPAFAGGFCTMEPPRKFFIRFSLQRICSLKCSNVYSVCDTHDQRVCQSPKTFCALAVCQARGHEGAVLCLFQSQGTVTETGDSRLANQMSLWAADGCLGPEGLQSTLRSPSSHRISSGRTWRSWRHKCREARQMSHACKHSSPPGFYILQISHVGFWFVLSLVSGVGPPQTTTLPGSKCTAWSL